VAVAAACSELVDAIDELLRWSEQHDLNALFADGDQLIGS
jgi:hypothetical protein